MKANLFIVGVAKAGTSYLHQLLASHDLVQMSEIKEPHYFSRASVQIESKHAGNVSQLSDYHQLFQEYPDTQYFGESSPSYLWDELSASKIHDYNPESKIIIMLRDPVERAYSHYHMDLNAKRETDTNFLNALKSDQKRQNREWGKARLYIDLGYYNDAIDRFQHVFGVENVLILKYEEFFPNLPQSQLKVWNFLSLDAPSNEDKIAKRVNESFKLSSFGNYLRRTNAAKFLPEGLKQSIKSLMKTNAKPSKEAVAYLLNLYKSDILKLKNELRDPFYYEWVKAQYGTDLERS